MSRIFRQKPLAPDTVLAERRSLVPAPMVPLLPPVGAAGTGLMTAVVVAGEIGRASWRERV